jgi:c-di-GMP-binding flagellar brake protein YcgR
VSNRRRFVRVRARLRFTYAWAEAFELYATLDVSASGALVRRVDAPMTLPPLGAEGECAFTVDATEVRTRARVVRVSEDGFAVRYLGMPRPLEDKLAAWAFRMEAQALSRRMRA